MRRRIEAEPLVSLDYVAVVDDGSFAEIGEIAAPAWALVAARVGKTRLIDNVPLSRED
jgi:pantoate--beta-alanine ligase